MDGHLREIEIAQLNLRYAHTRIDRLKECLALAASIERIGQIVPVIVVREELILLDGYLRVKALKRLGRDTVMAETWGCTEEEALIAILARAHRHKRDLLEEAALLRELHDHYHLSQEKIASRVGRTQGWVSTRLALYHALSDDLIALIRKGSISTWTATRVIVPIARAMPEHGKALSESLSRVSLSTREMVQFLHHYKKANRRQRENMVREPVLFLKSLCVREEARESKTLKEGPEGRWLRDFRVITHMLKGLLKEVPLLFHRGQNNLDRRILLTAFHDSQKQLTALEQTIRRYDDYGGDKTGHCKSVPAGSSDPADRQDFEDLPEHGKECDPGETTDAKRVSL